MPSGIDPGRQRFGDNSIETVSRARICATGRGAGSPSLKLESSAFCDRLPPRMIAKTGKNCKCAAIMINATKGFGFIQPSSGGKDVFVHISAVEKAGLSTLNEGQTVEYEEVANRGKTSAENLKV
jgi:CspA family cold shock protein